MKSLSDRLRETFQEEDARYAYAEDFLNSSIAAQIKTLRDDRKLSQEELAALLGTKQPGISRLENTNYSAWKVETLRKLARAFGLRLRISFEEFGTLIHDIENFNREELIRRKFEDDPVFHPEVAAERLAALGAQKSKALYDIGDFTAKKTRGGSDEGHKQKSSSNGPLWKEEQKEQVPPSRESGISSNNDANNQWLKKAM